MIKNIDKFITACRKRFGSRLISIIAHGSGIFETDYWDINDYDLVVVLKNKQFLTKDIKVINSIIKSIKIEIDLDLQLFYLEELPSNADLYSQNTNGCFFAWHLRGSVLLYGQNIFDLMIGPSQYQVRLSLLQKIRQYAHVIRKMNISGRPITSKEEAHVLIKFLFKMIKDTLMIEGILEQNKKKSILLIQKMCPKMFKKKDLQFLFRLNSNENIWKEKENFLSWTMNISEKIYQNALSFACLNMRFKRLKL